MLQRTVRLPVVHNTAVLVSRNACVQQVFLSTGPPPAKSILHRMNQEKKDTKTWLQQKLKEEQQMTKKSKQIPKATKAPRQTQQRANTKPSASDGFLKLDQPTEPVDQTHTEKTLKQKTKWLNSLAAREKMELKLKDSTLAGWQRRKIEFKLKHGDEKWEPTKKIAVSSMEKIRLLNSEFPEIWTLKKLSEQFKVSQETVRRIIKSKYRPTDKQIEEREEKRRAQMNEYKKSIRSTTRDVEESAGHRLEDNQQYEKRSENDQGSASLSKETRGPKSQFEDTKEPMGRSGNDRTSNRYSGSRKDSDRRFKDARGSNNRPNNKRDSNRSPWQKRGSTRRKGTS